MYYPLIQPIVESTCKEFDVPYHNYPSVSTPSHVRTVLYSTTRDCVVIRFRFVVCMCTILTLNPNLETTWRQPTSD